MPEVVSNARQIGLALFEFEVEYESYPSPKTIAEVQAKNPSGLHLGTKTSNDYFRQLIAAEITASERLFYAKVPGARKPDDVILPGRALEAGECGFAYLMSDSQIEDRPLVVTPLIPGTNRFDRKPFDGKAIVLRGDNSVIRYAIDKDGHARVGGVILLDPSHPVWEGKGLTIAWPE